MEGGKDKLPGTGPTAYPPFAVTVDVALFTLRRGNLHALLVKRGQAPFRGSWALPGGFVQAGEDLEAAAARELDEETGLRVPLEQLRSYGAPDRDPRMRVVSVVYWSVAAELPDPEGGGDAADAELVRVKDVESGEIPLAFDHDRILRDALDRTRSKLEYTALAARFCGPRFTIAKLRNVYEAVWNKRLDPGNFQRNFRKNPCFVQCGNPSANAASNRGRPASVWRLKATGHFGLAPRIYRPLATR